MVINPITKRVTFIQQLSSNNFIGTATGFFYRRENKLFLVTNRHVVIDQKSKMVIDTLRLLLHNDLKTPSNNSTFDVPLYSSEMPLWKDHPNYEQADIVLIELDENEIQGKFLIEAWSASDFLPSKYLLDPGEDVFIMGYPRAFFDKKHNLPVFRNAMIASTYGVSFNGFPYFLTDAHLHPGTSGSPVITKARKNWIDSDGNYYLAGSDYYILGIHSGTHYTPLGNEIKEPLGLGIAWYIRLVEEIAKLF